MSKFQWLTQKQFRQRFDSEFAPNKRWLFAESWMDISESKLRAIIPTKPEDTPLDEGDFPGPTLRWYGAIDDFLFTLDARENGNEYAILTHELSAKDTIASHVLTHFGTPIAGSFNPLDHLPPND